MSDPRGPVWRRSSNGHACNWPGCDAIVAGRLWACRDHWLKVPVELRDAWMSAGSGRAGPRGTRLQNRPAARLVDHEIRHWIAGEGL